MHPDNSTRPLFLNGQCTLNDVLTNASIQGKLQIVQFCLDTGATQYQKNWALIEASQFGHLDIVQYLVKNGADIGFYNSCCVQRACKHNHLEIVKYLISNVVNINDHLNSGGLINCCEYGHMEILQVLVENGADINIPRYDELPIEVACINDQLEILKYLVQKGANILDKHCLRLACTTGSLRVVKYLVENGAYSHVEKVPLSPIEYAYFNGKVSIVFYLLPFQDVFKSKIESRYIDFFDMFYILITTFYNDEKWTKIPEVKQDYLFDPNLSLIIASFAF